MSSSYHNVSSSKIPGAKFKSYESRGTSRGSSDKSRPGSGVLFDAYAGSTRAPNRSSYGIISSEGKKGRRFDDHIYNIEMDNGYGNHRGARRPFVKPPFVQEKVIPGASGKEFDNKTLIETASLKSLKVLLKQFDMIEKREWPSFLNDLNGLFRNSQFSKSAAEKPHRVVDDVTRILSRILTTKLFPDIIQGVICAITSLSTALKYNCRDLFSWIFDFYENSSDETRIVLLKAVKRILDSRGKGVAECLSVSNSNHNIMVKLKSVLEETESCLILMELTDIFSVIGKNYQTIFSRHFMDIIDILIAWFLDSHQQNPALIQKMTQSFLGFKGFWHQEMASTQILLQNFMDDFENSFDHFKSDTDQEIVTPDSGGDSASSSSPPSLPLSEAISHLDKMASLVSIYVVVFKSLGDHISSLQPQDSSKISNFMLNSLRSVLNSVTFILKSQSWVHEDLVVACNQCTIFTIEIFGGEGSGFISSTKDDILHYLDYVRPHLTRGCDAYIITTLGLKTRMVKTLGGNIPLDFVTKILSHESECQNLRYYPSKSIQCSLYELHHSILAIKNVPLLEEAYKCFLMQLKQAFYSLTDVTIDISSDVAKCASVAMSPEKAKISINSTLISLAEVANAKHSLIAMWALKPSFYDLIIEHLDPSRDMMIQDNCDLQYQLVYLIYSHSNKHHHFISSSSLFRSTTSHVSAENAGFNSIIAPPTSGYLIRTISFLNRILRRSKLTKDLRIICLKWFQEIWDGTKSCSDQLIKSPEFLSLLEIISDHLFMKDASTCILSSQILKSLFKRHDATIFPPEVIMRAHDASHLHIWNTNRDVRKEFEGMLHLLPLFLPKSQDEISSRHILRDRDFVLYPGDVVLSKYTLMRRESNSCFSGIYFRTIMSFILEGKSPNSDLGWMKRLFYLSLNEDAPLKQHFSLKSTSKGCVHSNFGSEQNVIDVFVSNESALIYWSLWEVASYCVSNKLRTFYGKPQELLGKIATCLSSINNSNQDGSTEMSETRVRMVLMLMEMLDKQMSNAVEGSGLRLSIPSKTARQFFRTNRATCIEWLTRNRMSLMKVAGKFSDPAVVWRNGSEQMKELIASNKSSQNEMQNILLLMVDALIELDDRESMIGLYILARDTLNIRCPWIKPCLKEAGARFEEASQQYCQVLDNIPSDEESSESSATSQLRQFLKRRLVASYMKIGSFEDAIKWKNEDESSRMDDLIQKIQKLEVTSQKELTFPPKEVLESMSRSLMRQQEVRYQESISEWLPPLKKSLDAMSHSLRHLFLNGSNESIVDNLRIVAQVTHSLSYPEAPSKTLRLGDMSELSIAQLMQIMNWSKEMGDRDAPKCLNLTVAKEARKTGNFKLSQNLLMQGLVGLKITGSSSHESFSDMLSLQKIEKLEDAERYYAGAKLIMVQGKSKETVDLLSRFCLTQGSPEDEYTEIRARGLLTLAKFVESDASCFSHLDSNGLLNYLKTEYVFMNIPDEKSVVGHILQKSANICPTLAKSHVALGNWAIKTANMQHTPGVYGEEDFKSNHDRRHDADSMYGVAAKSYFTYLRLNEGNHDDYPSITVALTLLRILVKHWRETEEILLKGFSSCPTTAWRNITIQLFSHLSHSHEDFVIKTVSDLMCRIGKETPHVVVYPAVAGSLSGKESMLVLDILGDDKSNTRLDPENNNNQDIMQNMPTDESDLLNNGDVMNGFEDLKAKSSVYSDIVSVLTSYNPQLISQTVLFINEMRRITLLWDDLWIGTLLCRLGEVKKKVDFLDQEVDKMNEMCCNWTLQEKQNYILKKHQEAFQKLISVLRETQAETVDSYPETCHEKWFQTTFSDMIVSTIDSIKNPPDVLKPQQTLISLQQLLQNIQKRSMDLSPGGSKLVMDTISPVLATLSDSVISIPGVKDVVIQKVNKTVTILHTKTKPKRIAFSGSDGETYNFLFKGHEDLHLDERIMQMLGIINKMLRRKGNRMGRKVLKARNYSVTPLGSKSGLIEWLEGKPPLFSFYKRWLLNKPPPVTAGSKNTVAPDVADVTTKPTEIFSRKLREKGITSSNRNEWPKETLIEIHKELVRETSSSLISRELLYASCTTQEFYEMTQNFTRSNAVMAIIGYIIGLGDRHLDNILIDMVTGEIIHIDYNVCFERGRSLRVPERVPSRLTNSIVTTFGITGVEGTFRTSAEHVLKLLRRERDTILMLLEAFVYDPLLEWTVYGSSEKGSLNPVAVKAWKKIRNKLEGREVTTGDKRQTVPEQVDMVIRQSMDISHLAFMYEGFTSWL